MNNLQKISSFLNSTTHYKNQYIYPEELIIEDEFPLVYALIILIIALIPKKSIKKTDEATKIPPKSHLIISSFCLVSSCILLPIIFAFILVFGILRSIVEMYLKIKYGRQFGGLLDGTDTIWAIEDISKSIINILIIIKSPEKTSGKLHRRVTKILREKFFKNDHFPKLTSVRSTCFGYNFLIKNQFTVKECVKMLRVRKRGKLTRKHLQTLIGEQSNKSMPKNNRALWEVLVSPKPIQWSNDDAAHYPVVFRIHHSLGDGTSLIRLLVNSLACKTDHFSDTPIRKKESTYWSRATGTVRLWARNLCVLIFAPATMILQSLMKAQDVNDLHGEKLCGEKIAAWAVEDKAELIQTVQNIRKKLPGTRFSEILLTAISASFAEFYEKYRKTIPESITAVIPALIENPHSQLGNNSFSVGMLNVPICMDIEDIDHDCRTSALLDRLAQIKEQTDLLRNSPDYQVNYWLLSVVSAVLPEPILRPILHSAHSTVVISNLPGIEKVHIFDSYELDDLVFWIPHRGTTGVGFSIMSYDKRFQLGLLVDKTLISQHEQIEAILRNTFKYLRLLNEEINKV